MAFLDNDGVTRLTGDYLDIFARKEDAVLDPSGGLIRTDDGISIDSLVRESDGEVSGAIAELTAKGHAEQFSTTGKNLFDTSGMASTETRNGVTFTNHGDGTFSASGTATANVSFGLASISKLQATMGNGGTYTGSLKNATYDNDTCNIAIAYSENGTTKFLVPTGSPFTLSSGITVTSADFFVRSGKTVNLSHVGTQLELGSTATAYEPYTGGAPSPSPDYPQEIQVVRGRNLLTLQPSRTINGVTISQDADGCIHLNGTSNASVFFNVPLSDKIPSGTTCTLKMYANVSSNPVVKARLETSINALMPTQVETSALSSMQKTFILEYSASNWVVVVPANQTYDDVRFYVQLELGSTPTLYVPYGHVGMTVQGKNLLNPSTFVQGGIDGSNGSIDGGNYSRITSDWIPVDPSTQYVLQWPSGLKAEVYEYDANKAYKQRPSITWRTSPYTYTTQNRVSYVRVLLGLTNDANITPSYIVEKEIQLELGSTATEYEPYIGSTTPIPLPSRGWVAGLPDGTADELHLDGAGKVEWERKTGIKTFDGSEGWTVEQTGTDKYFYQLYSSALGFRESTEVLANKYTSASVVSANTNNGICIVGNGLLLRVRYGTEVSIADYKASLASTNLILLAPLATPVTEDCGYVDMPAIPADATVTIPELDALGIKYFVDDSSNVLAKQWHERIDTETDEKIAANNDIVESNIAMIESSTAKSNHAVGSYFMLDNVLHKATSAIASGETITSGSNATPITLEQAISALNSSVESLQDSMYRDGVIDLNSISTTGFRYAYNASSNLPVQNNGGMVITVAGGGGISRVQAMVPLGRYEFYVRFFGSGEWSAWQKP